MTFSHSAGSWSLPRKRAAASSLNQASAPSAAEGLGDAGVDGGVAQDLHAAVVAAFHEAGQRHAPGALARQHPVGPRLDHRVQPVAPVLRRPGHQLVDRGQRAFADRRAVGVEAVAERLVDGDEPLRRVAVDHRRLRAPGMRVGMGEPAAGDQRAGLGQRLDDRAGWRPSPCPWRRRSARRRRAADRRESSKSSSTLKVIGRPCFRPST